ncbi:MAG: amino acid permease [Calditrichia bacterium]
MMVKTGPTDSEQTRSLGVWATYFMIVGNVVGVGIFTTNGYISNYIHSPILILSLWVLGGILAICGALTYAELSSRFPVAGGDFVFLSRAIHPFLGFVFGWSALMVTYTGSIAVIAVGMGNYALHFFPEGLKAISVAVPGGFIELGFDKILAILAILAFTYLNTFKLKLGVLWQGFLTVFGVSVLLMFIGVGLTSPYCQWQNLNGGDWNVAGGISGFGNALAAVFFTYSGWTAAVYVAGEVKNPQRNIPRALLGGLMTVMSLYLATQLVFILAAPVAEMKDQIDLGLVALNRLRGPAWVPFFNLIITFAILSTLNATILSGARIYYAMGRRGDFIAAFGKLHPENGTPVFALWAQAIWSILLIASGSFNQLLSYTVFMMVCFAFLAGVAQIILRIKAKGEAGFRMPIFPFPVILFMFMTGWIMLETLLHQPQQAMAALILVLLGWPVYLILNSRQKKSPEA